MQDEMGFEGYDNPDIIEQIPNFYDMKGEDIWKFIYNLLCKVKIYREAYTRELSINERAHKIIEASMPPMSEMDMLITDDPGSCCGRAVVVNWPRRGYYLAADLGQLLQADHEFVRRHIAEKLADHIATEICDNHLARKTGKSYAR